MPPQPDHPPLRPLGTSVLTGLALIAFASNSILTRLALGPGHIDAPGFTSVRLLSGTLVLVALVKLSGGRWSALGVRGWASRSVPAARTTVATPSLAGPLALFAYAAPFSFAYLRIGAAAGALVLFGSVQLTMIGWGLARGERPGPQTWLGLALALAGLVILTLPAASRPDLPGIMLMVTAGVAWGAYSIQGKGAPDPLAANARAFLWSTPLALMLSALTFRSSSLSAFGLLLAAVSGAVTSALGYAIWYRALGGLTATRAAILQLSVPVIAGIGAVIVLDERPTGRLGLAVAAVIGGVALALTDPRRKARAR